MTNSLKYDIIIYVRRTESKATGSPKAQISEVLKMAKGVIFTGTDGKKTRMNREEFVRYIGNLWKVAREAKLEAEKADKEIEENSD